MRLIDADALDKRLQDISDGLKKLFGNSRFEFMRADIAAQITTTHEIWRQIMAVPPIDAEPVRHGRWEWYEDWGPSTWLEPPDLNKAGWKCSNCGIDLGDYLTDCLGVNVYVDEEDKMPKIKSCPHCGAKMDGVEK